MSNDYENKQPTAKIFQPAKNAMQSGKARMRKWVLEFDQSSPRIIDPVMGYTGVSDTQTQVRLTFDSSEEAVSYAQRKGIKYRLVKPNKAKRRKMSYTDNFSFDRAQPWTH